MTTPGKGDGRFPTTHWTLIGRLKSADEATALRALDEICAQYHFPLYCVIRHRGLAHHDAEDALHDFLAKLLRAEAFAGADAKRGRLRAYLSTALGRFLSNWHRDRAARTRDVSLEELTQTGKDEARYHAAQFPDHETPGRLFDRQWACELLARVLSRLAADYKGRGKEAIFSTLAPVLQGGGSLRGEEPARLAATLGLNEAALRKANHRFMQDYRSLLEEEVFQTVETREEVGAEIDHLLAVFRKG